MCIFLRRFHTARYTGHAHDVGCCLVRLQPLYFCTTDFAGAMDRLDNDTQSLIMKQLPHSARLVCGHWRNAYDAAVKHTFAARTRFTAVDHRMNGYGRLLAHRKATRLGFRHASVGSGNARRVLVWHPTGPVTVSLATGPGGVTVRLQQGAVTPERPKRKRIYFLPEEAEEGAPECIKCGFRAWDVDSCPECGRPVM